MRIALAKRCPRRHPSAVTSAAPRSAVSAWFESTFGKPTPAQAAAWPLIAHGKNVLVASPTGTGKTFAAFYSVLHSLALEQSQGTLRSSIYCIYVSPLRALSYDLEKNLNGPLQAIYGENPPIRVELRTGDTSGAQRTRQFQRPPHILLTTPESICLLLSQEKWIPLLASIRWLIVDEIHALADNKRGAHLAISLERLSDITQGNRAPNATPDAIAISHSSYPQRIGLSATIAPLEEAALFLSGTNGECSIVDVTTKKRVELSIYTPLRREPYPPSGFTGERLVKELGALVKNHRTTLVFCNTRSGAEATAFWLRENFPEIANEIECHHASLEREVRREVEDRLKRGELRAVICSTSLELGIDIGSVDIVVMLATPKGVSRALQRAGRAGHNIHSVSRGVLMATNVSDLVEACATVRLAKTRRLDGIRISRAPLDVLAQHLVSMGCTQEWNRNEALSLIRKAYPYAGLTQQEFDDVLDYLAGGGKSLRQQYTDVFGKIELDDDCFQTREGRVRREFLQNIGVIPSVGSVRVRLHTQSLGSVEESFIRTMKIGDVFIMAGRPVRLEKVSQMDAWVARADGEIPTVPRWNAAKMPLSNRVCEEIIDFRRGLRDFAEGNGITAESDLLGKESKVAKLAAAWIANRLDCGAANATVIWKIHAAQIALSEIPTADFLLVEEHLEYPRDHPEELAEKRERKLNKLGSAKSKSNSRSSGNKQPLARHYFFHSLIGRAANDALARVVSLRLSQLRGGNALATPHDYGFVLSVTPGQQITQSDLRGLLDPGDFEQELDAALAQSEMMKYHFRNAAQTGLMVYRNFFDQHKPVRKLAWSAEVIFNVLKKYEPDHILLREARRETMHTFVDAPGARAFLEQQASRPFRLRAVPSIPPLSFAMYATKIKEALLVEDPFETMERLYHFWWQQANPESEQANK